MAGFPCTAGMQTWQTLAFVGDTLTGVTALFMCLTAYLDCMRFICINHDHYHLLLIILCNFAHFLIIFLSIELEHRCLNLERSLAIQCRQSSLEQRLLCYVLKLIFDGCRPYEGNLINR